MALHHKAPRLVVLISGQSIPLNTMPITVGRQITPQTAGSDIGFPDRTVGRWHARIDDQGSYTIEDLGSPNGTLLNGVRITSKQKYALHDGDTLQFGIVKVRFEL